jgi:nitrogen fixation-related uncharacterized protein
MMSNFLVPINFGSTVILTHSLYWLLQFSSISNILHQFDDLEEIQKERILLDPRRWRDQGLRGFNAPLYSIINMSF